jgi:hypothetical protein
MKKIIIVIVAGLLAQQTIQAQGTVTYLSNLGQTSTGSFNAGSDSWLGALFETGRNATEYVFNSVQLALANATGSPNGFTVMLYSVNIHADSLRPESSLGTLDGSANPSTAGTYTYTDDSNITLSPSTFYYIVLTSGTSVANGAYEWSLAGANSYNPTGGFIVDGFSTSNNGSSWNLNFNLDFAQYAITATPVPEPSPSFLLLLGSGIFIYVRRAFHR